jgi:uncharacterized protein (TIGR00661 family)
MRLLFGICGIGHGHTYRQLPLIEHFAQSSENQLVLFAYGESLQVFTERFAGNPAIAIERVAVPFYAGTHSGLDFEATAQRPSNRAEDYLAINCAAMARAAARIGRPDLVISDYEPVSAQYAYAFDAPLATVDQQSKYLCGEFPTSLGGAGFLDEVMRLRMFFPKAALRLACSFFAVAPRAGATESVTVCPPILSEAITLLVRRPRQGRPLILVYLSSQQPFGQGLAEVEAILHSQPAAEFHLFGRGLGRRQSGNSTTHEHGDAEFHQVLASCHGIVSTAGHMLLSEAMFLGIPVYAIPLGVYEQQMNAHVIASNGLGAQSPRLERAVLAEFLSSLPRYRSAIDSDRSVLLRGSGLTEVAARLRACAGESRSIG